MTTYLIASSISFLLLFQIALILSMVKPELFTLILDIPAREDVVREQIRKEDVPDPVTMEEEIVILEDEDIVDNKMAMLEDSITYLQKRLDTEIQSNKVFQDKIAQLTERIEERKADNVRDFAKIIESMDSEEAAKVLGELQDSKVRDILLNVNRRQAARIMNNMEPGRIAKIMEEEFIRAQ